MVAPAYEIAACIICGGSRHSVVADPDAIRAEVEELWEFHSQRLLPEVPHDRLTDRVSFSQRPPIAVVRCEGCGLLYRNPRERAASLEEIYAQEESTDDSLDALFETQRKSSMAQARRLTRANGGRTGRLLEVGSYVGGFLAAAERKGWYVEGLDVNDSAIRVARNRGLRVRHGSVDRFAPGTTYDAVVFYNCFEQLPDPRSAAIHARSLLAPDGLLALRVPNGEFYAYWRSRLRGPRGGLARALLAHNNLLTFPYRHGFTLPSLVRLVTRLGFRVVKVAGDSLVPIADEWTQGWATWEERLTKLALRARARLAPENAPWLELYARVTKGAATDALSDAATP